MLPNIPLLLCLDLTSWSWKTELRRWHDDCYYSLWDYFRIQYFTRIHDRILSWWLTITRSVALEDFYPLHTGRVFIRHHSNGANHVFSKHDKHLSIQSSLPYQNFKNFQRPQILQHRGCHEFLERKKHRKCQEKNWDRPNSRKQPWPRLKQDQLVF